MRLYFDAAYVAKCYVNEPDGKAVRKLARRASSLCSSMLSIAEVACVFHRQIREARLTSDQASEWRGRFLEDVRNGVWVLLPVTERILYRIDSLAAGLPPAAYVRAGDAIHLVTAFEAGFTEIWTNDRHLLNAAPHFGLSVKTV